MCSFWPSFSSNHIERIQKRVLRIIYPGHGDYESLLLSLKERGNRLFATSIADILDPAHKLHRLLPKRLNDVGDNSNKDKWQKGIIVSFVALGV